MDNFSLVNKPHKSKTNCLLCVCRSSQDWNSLSEDKPTSPISALNLTCGTPYQSRPRSRCRAGPTPDSTRPPPGRHEWRPTRSRWSWPGTKGKKEGEG